MSCKMEYEFEEMDVDCDEVEYDCDLDEDTMAVRLQLEKQWRHAEGLLQKACDKLDALARALTDEKSRHERCRERKQTTGQQMSYLRIQTLEGVRSMYYEYSSRKAEEISLLWAAIQDCVQDEQHQQSIQMTDDHMDFLQVKVGE